MNGTGSKRSLSNIIPRSLLGLSNFSVFASSAIITGLISYFLHHYRYRNTHLVYQEVIAVLTLLLYLFAMALPALKSYRGYGLPLTAALSYLWLTSLIFSSQDYSGRRCHYHSPPTAGHCGLKHTIQAFQILGFCSLLLNTILEAIMWAEHRRQQASPRGPIDKGAINSVPDSTIPGTSNGQQV